MAEKQHKAEIQVSEKQYPTEEPSSLPIEGRLTGDYISSGRKSSWPEVVGLSAEEAERKIKEDMPPEEEEAYFQILPLGAFVTMDYRTNRVRIFIDDSGKVAATPTIG